MSGRYASYWNAFLFLFCSALEWQWLQDKQRNSAAIWKSKHYTTANLVTRSSTTGRKQNSSVRKDGVVPTVTHENNNGLGLTVTHALWDGLVMTVTHVLMDGFLRPVIRSVKDSAAVTMTTARAVSRKVSGMEKILINKIFKLFLRSVEKPALTWFQVGRSIYHVHLDKYKCVCVCTENVNMIVMVQGTYCTTLVPTVGCTSLTNDSNVEFS